MHWVNFMCNRFMDTPIFHLYLFIQSTQTYKSTHTQKEGQTKTALTSFCHSLQNLMLSACSTNSTAITWLCTLVDFILPREQLDQNLRPLVRVRNRKTFFLFLNRNICCGYSKEPSQWEGSFPKHTQKIMGKKIFKILLWKCLFI